MTTPTNNLYRALGHLALETSRPTSRDPEEPGITGRQGRNPANTGGDSPAMRAGAPTRVGRRRLANLAEELGDRDRQILGFLDAYKYATTSQLARRHAHEFGSARSAIRQTNRQLSKLERYGLLRRLERRIGGIRAGSASTIWTLTTAGRKTTLTADASDDQSSAVRRVRAVEPSMSFLDHTLAVTEVAIQLDELVHGGHLASVTASTESACWRRYVGPAGQPVWLKPDLAAVTGTTDGFEDHWFVEVDRATENPARIVTKCRSYTDYRSSGREQADVGVFPAVLWVVPDERRRDQLRERLASEAGLVHGLFRVVTLNDFKATIASGPTDTETLNDKPEHPKGGTTP